VKVVYSEEAERCIARENAAGARTRITLFSSRMSLRRRWSQIQQNPNRPVYEMTRRGPVRRALMPKTGNHVYFLFFQETQTIEIVSVAGGKRKRGPVFDR